MKLLVVIAALLAVASAEKVRYDNYTVFRLVPTDDRAFEALKQLEEAELPEYRFWTSVVKVGYPADVLVPPTHIKEVERMVAELGMKSEVMMGNIQDHIDAEGFRPASRAGGFDWVSYHDLDEYNDFLQSLADTYPNIVTLVRAGFTYQGRPIFGVRVSYSSANLNNAIFLEANIHAREWISGAVSTYILNELLTSTDREVRNLAETHDWYVFPIFNPDGFHFTYTNDRMWRKTRVPYTSILGRTCYGADPNRNWAYYWNSGGSSSSACSDTYMGSRAFSEPSTRALSDYISTIGNRLVAYISFHSYSQLLLVPYGYTSAHLDNYAETYRIGVRAAQALARRYGTQYTVGNVPEILYVASGGSMDWVKGTFGTPLAYTYELRDTGRHGFILPASEILPTAEETLDSLVAIFREYESSKNEN